MECPGDACKKKKTVHLTEIINGDMSEMHLCEDCPKLHKIQTDQQFGLAGMLSEFADLSKMPSIKEDKQVLKCAGCGLTYEEFRKYGRLGCAQCYEAFEKPMEVLLKNIHGSNDHRGKSPTIIAPTKMLKPVKTVKPKQIIEKPVKPEVIKKPVEMSLKDKIKAFELELDQVIDAQDFEKAAVLRDQINELKKQL